MKLASGIRGLDNTLEQAQDRSGGKHGNKGVEARYGCLRNEDG